MSILSDIPGKDKAHGYALKDLRAQIDPMLAQGPEARLIMTHSADVLAANSAGEKLIHAFNSLDDIKRKSITQWLAGNTAKDFELKLPLADASTVYVLHAIRLDIGQLAPLFLIIARQPNLSSHLIQALSQSRALYKDIVQTIPGLVWETRADGCFSFISGEDVPGIDIAAMVDMPPAQAFDVSPQAADPVFLTTQPSKSVDFWFTAPDGERRCLSVSAKPILSKGGLWMGARGIALDVTTDRHEADAADAASQQMISAAISDELTGLLNRRGFHDRLEKVCGQIRAADAGGYLALIDLDKFKQLNDTHGHQKGDDALVAVGQLLLRHTRREDIAGRLGGDEFILWIDNANEEGVHRICQNLINSMPALCEDIDLPGFGLGMSIGVTRLKPGEDTPDTLIERADRTMYAVKNAGRGAYLFDDAEADTWA